MALERSTTQFNQPMYTTSRGDVVSVEGGHVQMRVAGTNYNSLGFEHHNPDGAANVLATVLEQAYQQGRADALAESGQKEN